MINYKLTNLINYKEDLVEALHLQRAARDGEVDHGDPGADVGPELDGGVARRQEDRERRRQVDVLKVSLILAN